MTPLRALRIVLAVLDARMRTSITLLGVMVAAERGLAVAAAFAFDAGDRSRVYVLAALACGLWVARALVRIGLRVRVLARLYETAAHAVLGAAGGASVSEEAEARLFEGVQRGSTLVESVPLLVGDGIASLVIGVVLALTQPLSLVAGGALVIAVTVVVSALAGRIVARAQDAGWTAYQPLLDRMIVIVRGRTEIVANGATEACFGVLDATLERFRRDNHRAQLTAGIAGRAPLVAGAGAVALLVLVAPDVHIGALVLASALVLATAAPAFIGLSTNAHELWRGGAAVRPLAELLSLPPRPRGGAGAAPTAPTKIVFRGVGFRYPEAEHDALSNVSLEFGRDAPLVLRGPNGSGKSTLLSLLAGLASSTTGEILVDGTDLASVDGASWRDRVAYLPQQPHLPEGWSVLEAVRLIAPDVTESHLRDLLDRVGVLDVLERHDPRAPLSVAIGELSVGQRKRIAIARVLARDAPVVLLDEPDANLDDEGVAMVAELVDELATTRLVVIAAHTPAIRTARGILVELAA